MKKYAMMITVVGVVLVSMGAFFKLQHLTGSSELLMAGLMVGVIGFVLLVTTALVRSK